VPVTSADCEKDVALDLKAKDRKRNGWRWAGGTWLEGGSTDGCAHAPAAMAKVTPESAIGNGRKPRYARARRSHASGRLKGRFECNMVKARVHRQIGGDAAADFPQQSHQHGR